MPFTDDTAVCVAEGSLQPLYMFKLVVGSDAPGGPELRGPMVLGSGVSATRQMLTFLYIWRGNGGWGEEWLSCCPPSFFLSE